MQNTCVRHVDGSEQVWRGTQTQCIHPSILFLLFLSGLMIIGLPASQSFAIQTRVHFLLLVMWHRRQFLWRYLSSWCQRHLTIHCQLNWLEDWLLYQRIFFSGSLSPCLCLFVIYLYAIMVNNLLHSIRVQLSWCIYLDFRRIWIVTMGGKCRCVEAKVIICRDGWGVCLTVKNGWCWRK